MAKHYYKIDGGKSNIELRLELDYYKDPVNMSTMGSSGKRGIYLSFILVEKDSSSVDSLHLFGDPSGVGIESGYTLVKEMGRRSIKQEETLEQLVDFDWIADKWIKKDKNAVFAYLEGGLTKPIEDIQKDESIQDTIHYFHHPESSSVWTDTKSLEETGSDGFVEEIDKEEFDKLHTLYEGEEKVKVKEEKQSVYYYHHPESATLWESEKSPEEENIDESVDQLDEKDYLRIKVSYNKKDKATEAKKKGKVFLSDFSTGVEYAKKLQVAYLKKHPKTTHEEFIAQMKSAFEKAFVFETEKMLPSIISTLDEIDAPYPLEMGYYTYERNIMLTSPSQAEDVLMDLYMHIDSEYDLQCFRSWIEQNYPKIFDPETDLDLIEMGMERLQAKAPQIEASKLLSGANPMMEESQDMSLEELGLSL